jgi:hypothetical protein
LFRIAVRDELVKKLYVEVSQMLKPVRDLQDPELKRRVEAEMARELRV